MKIEAKHEAIFFKKAMFIYKHQNRSHFRDDLPNASDSKKFGKYLLYFTESKCHHLWDVPFYLTPKKIGKGKKENQLSHDTCFLILLIKRCIELS